MAEEMSGLYCMYGIFADACKLEGVLCDIKNEVNAML